MADARKSYENEIRMEAQHLFGREFAETFSIALKRRMKALRSSKYTIEEPTDLVDEIELANRNLCKGTTPVRNVYYIETERIAN